MFRIVASMCLLVLFAWVMLAAGPADVIFVGASVLAADASRPIVEAIAIESERIAGPEKEVRRLARSLE